MTTTSIPMTGTHRVRHIDDEELARAAMLKRAAHRRALRKRVFRSGWNIVALVISVVMIFPVYWMVASSFKTGKNLQRIVPQWFPAPLTLDNYTKALQQPRFLSNILNSVLVVGGTALVALVIGFIASLALARMNFKGRTALVLMVITIQMVPIGGVIIPVFLILNSAGLTNSLFGLGLAYLAFVLPFTVWMLRGFITAVPKDLEEAALVDGCSRGQAFRRIILPLAAPGLVATTIFAVIQGWNEYLYALVLLKDNSKQTIPIWLDTFVTQKGIDWGALMAASTLVSIPVVILFSLVQRNIATGITSGAVKG